ncbi:MAG: hypothetical protein A2085_09095 [Gemmatimonadetes bacterium GWC2_71_10]|nr:MAG: hypothetical protein A2085_09095 [Gemmatimonadetes bacterium GWC2_71_10]
MLLRYRLPFALLAAALVAACDDPVSAGGAADAAAYLTVVIGDGQSGGRSSPLPQNVLVLVTDSVGLGVPGVTVRFLVTSGGGSVVPAEAVSDSNGLAETTWTLGSSLGTQTMSARVARSDGPLLVSVTATALELTRVTVTGAPYGLSVNANGLIYATQLVAGTVAVATVTGKRVTATIPVGAAPTGVTFNPAGSEAYVTNQYSGSVSVISAASNTVVATIPVPYDPFVVGFSTTGADAFVATNVGMVYRINTATRAVTDSVFTGSGSNGLAASPNGSQLYVSAFDAGAVYEVALATFTIARTFTTGGAPQGMAVAADGSELYVANETGNLEVWNIAAGTRTTSVTIGPRPFGLALSPDGTKLYVSQGTGGTVTVIERQTRGVVDLIETSGDPRRLGLSTDGQTLVIANQYGWIDFVP